MSKIQVPTRDQVDSKSQEIFDDLNKKLGTVPNLYATIGHSSNALSSYLAFSGAQANGSFNAKEREAVSLAVSETNGCGYCVAAHTTLGKMNGFSEEETIALRDGSIEDEKLRVLSRLAISITENRGQADPELLSAFFELGYDEKALIDLTALVADKFFTNIVGRLTGIPIDFPEAQPLDTVNA